MGDPLPGGLRQSSNLPVASMGDFRVLPNELTIQVFSSLNVKDLMHVSQACKHWNYLSEDDFLWKPLYKKRWDSGPSAAVKKKKKRTKKLPSGKDSDQLEIKGWRSWKNKYTTNGNWLTGHLIYQTSFPAHQRAITAVQFDDEKYVTGSEDHTVRVFGGADAQEKRILTGHEGSISALQYDEKVLVTGSADKNIKVWKLETGECLQTLKGHHGKITCLQFQDHRLVTRAWDLNAKIWDLNTGQCISNRQCNSVCYSLVFDRHMMVCGYLDSQIKLWDMRTGQCYLTFTGHRVRFHIIVYFILLFQLLFIMYVFVVTSLVFQFCSDFSHANRKR